MTQSELDRKVFHLKSLSDLNWELSPVLQIDGLLERYLLVTMGTFGIRQGFALFSDREAQEGKRVTLASRGIDSVDAVSSESAEKLLYRCFEASEERKLGPMGISHIHEASHVFLEAGIGIDAEVGLLYYIDRTALGVIGLGPPISGVPFSKEDEDLLFTHTSSFMIYLKNAKAFERINELNEGLVRKNEELRRTIVELTEARHTIAILEKAGARIKALIQREMVRSQRMNALDIALILVLATVVGVLFNFANPQGIRLLPETLLRPDSTVVDPVEAKSLLDTGKAVLVDARPKEFYDQKHIKGAVNLPPALFDIIYMMKLAKLDPGVEIIVYGRSISRLYDEDVAHRLRRRDHEKVRILPGNMGAIETAGFEIGR